MSAQPNSRGIGGNQRYRRGAVCPICGGSEDDDRGAGRRCYGFLGSDGKYAHCTREDLAGGIQETPNSNSFAHRLNGPCNCGTEHGPAQPKVIIPRKARKPKGRIDVIYDYVDEQGELLFQAVRYSDPKGFSQRRPSGVAGTFVYSLGDVRRVLYRLPELIEADPSLAVFLVEGEKDVDNLRARGIVATCNPMGGGKWRPEYTSFLAGRTAFIIGDNDELGLKHAREVANSISGVARLVKVLDLAEACRRFSLGELPKNGDVSDFLEMGGTVDDLLLMFDGTPALDIPDQDPLPVAESMPAATPSRVPVEINTRRFEVVENCIKVLAERDPDIYRRGESLVTVIREEKDIVHLTVKTTMEGVAGSPKIVGLSDPVIGERLTRHCDFYQWRKSKGGEDVAVDVHPPDWLTKIMANRKHWPGIRPLVAVSECPFPRPDGSIVETPGYDEATAVLYTPSTPFPAIPANPTRDDARACWERLKARVAYFPFATEDDQVVFLAGALNVIARNGIVGPVPGVAVNGNKAGTGKELLVHGMTIPGTGRPAPATKYPHDRDEAGKVKTSIVRSGKSVVSFDNVEEGTSYGGADVDSLLTALTTDDRILGLSENTGEMVVRLVCFVNGNNISPVKDAYRRWLVCNLVTELEDPEQRKDIPRDNKPFRAMMLEERAEIVRDLLTILRAHTLAGWPDGGWPPLGSFEDWDRVVRGAVWFATDRDCCATQFKAAAESQDRRDKVALLEGWRELPGGKAGEGGVTTSEALELVKNNSQSYQSLRGWLTQRGKGGQLAESRVIGKALSALLNSTNRGLKLIKSEKVKHGAVLWMVESFRNEGATDPNQSEPDPLVIPMKTSTNPRVAYSDDTDWLARSLDTPY